MSRLPFNMDTGDLGRANFAKTRQAATGSPATAQPMTVSQAAGLIKHALAQGVPDRVQIVGEVSNFSNRTHWFFSLKDEGATLRCVCFASAARRVPCPMRDGMKIVATGRIDFYDTQGHVQLYVDRIEPVGQGALELRLREMIEELRELGYFDPARKKPLPMVPHCVAVVTSRSGAALQDVINTTRRRWSGCRLYLYDVRVQGAAAAPQIAAAVEALSRDGQRLGIDAILVTRGGGSIEDLWAFNERIVADAIYHCAVPIVAAIGHESDTTVAELVADLRCATPTQAAMHLVPDAAALSHQTHQLERRLSLLMARHIDHSRHRLTAVARHALFRQPQRLLEQAHARVNTCTSRLRLSLPRRMEPAAQRLTALDDRLRSALPRRLEVSRHKLDALTRQLGAVNPYNVLQRGYSYTLGPDGRVLRNAADAAVGDTITTVLQDGKVRSVVRDEQAGGPALSHTSSSPKVGATRRRKAKKDRPAGGLFDHS